MKLNIKHSIASLFVLAAVSLACKEELQTFQGPFSVRFTDTTLTFKESFFQVVKIKVHNTGPQLDQAVTVNYTISGTAREGRDYAIQGIKGTVTIPPRKSFGEIELKLINNANNILDNSNVIFTLTDVSMKDKLQVGFGQDGRIGKRLTLTIRDACIFDGTYTGIRTVRSQTGQLQNVGVADIDISSTDCRRYTVGNWNIALPLFNFDAEEPKITFIDNGNNSLTIPRQVIPELAAGYDTISGTGVYNPLNKRITLNLRIKTRTAARRDTFVVVPILYAPQPL